MAKRRFNEKPPTDLCSERSVEDGRDPRFDAKFPPRSPANRKALQLCRQVERALALALEGDLLRDLIVQSVVPAPDSSRMLVTVVYHGPAAVDTPTILAALSGAHASLRAEVAANIHRRKTPDFTFRVLRS